MKYKLKHSVLGIATLLSASAVPTNAAVIAEYLFTSGSNASTGSLGSTIGFQSGITNPAFANNRLEIGGDDTSGVALGAATYEAADQTRISGNNWVTFTITIANTQEIDLTTLTFDYTEINPAQFLLGVYTSKGGFTEGNHLFGYYRPALTAGTFSQSPVINLSGPAFQNLTNETVEFRFLLGDDSGSNTRIHVLDNITLNGTVTIIPEPSTALLGLLGAGLLLRRRR